MPRSAPDADTLLEHALTLIARRHGGEPSLSAQAAAELERWRAARPEHEEAWRRADALWGSSDASALRETVPVPANLARRRRVRRGTLAGLGLIAVGAGAAAVGNWYWMQPQFDTDLVTRRAQLLGRDLPDGTRIELNARTGLKVTYFRHRRVARLDAGEAAFRVAHDAGRPFIVETPLGGVRVVGTTFSVSSHVDAAGLGRMEVKVSEGRVKVWPLDAKRSPPADGADEGRALELGAGQSIRIDASGDGAVTLGPVQAVRPENIAAWRSGWLNFDNVRLAEVIERWNDYVEPPLQLDDALARSELRLTGSYPVRDPGAFLSGLAQTQPVRVVRADGGPVRIEALTRPKGQGAAR